MTTQIENSFRYEEIEYGIAGILEDELFYPGDFGLNPVQASTACYRGYYAKFTVTNSQLTLEHMEVRLIGKTDDGYRDEEGPLINGVKPCFDADGIFNNTYSGLHLPLNYSGGLLLVRGPIGETAFRVWEFSTVLELVFDDGVMQNVFDRSTSIADLRGTIADCFSIPYML